MAAEVIEVRTTTSYGARGIVETILSAPGVVVREVVLNTMSYLPKENTPSEDWPLIIRCSSLNVESPTFEIRVFGLTSGYAGTGPTDLVGCLKATKLAFDEKEILTRRRIKKVIQ